jgi:peptidoglycan/xylan/chitin deacetylase (PgdA/CDA1 family)
VAIVNETINRGHSIGYREITDFKSQTNEDIRIAVNQSMYFLKSKIDYDFRFIRLNYPVDLRVQRIVESMGLYVTAHTYDAMDYSPKYTTDVIQSVSDLNSSYVILYHDSSSNMIKDIGNHIDFLTYQGFKFVTLEDCILEDKDETRVTPPQSIRNGTTTVVASTNAANFSVAWAWLSLIISVFISVLFQFV